jgi:hypothetical protein
LLDAGQGPAQTSQRGFPVVCGLKTLFMPAAEPASRCNRSD